MIQYLIIKLRVEESWDNMYIALKVHSAHMEAR